MRRRILFVFILLVTLSIAQGAQAQEYSGAWAGTLTIDGTPGGMELTLFRDSGAWKSSMKWRLEGREIVLVVQELAIDGESISFSANVEGKTAKFAGKFEGDTLNGTMEGFQDGQKIGSGIFTLKRNGEMPTLPPRPPVNPGQVADENFDTKVVKPAYRNDGPRVLFDEAHYNFHTATGRYKPFADLISNDGYQIVPNKQKFSAEVLRNFHVLIISNALGAERMNDSNASRNAFTDQESDDIRDWVRAGGSLLLIADHAPMGSANQILAQRFDVDMSKKYTIDNDNFEQSSGNKGFIVYTRQSGSLADHPITHGRNKNERINKVIAFTGQSLKGPPGSFAFMKLADSAQDVFGQEKPISAAGRAQGLALKFGKGRVIVMGEAGMLTAQVTGPQRSPFGMNIPGIDNRQLALNIMHWLTKKL